MKIYKIEAITVYDELRKTHCKDIFIVKRDDNNSNKFFPSPLTYYLVKYCNSYNTKKRYGTCICSFINYVIRQTEKGINENFIQLKSQGLTGLTFYHLAHYINFISNNPENIVIYDTVKQTECILYGFYQFLSIAKIDTKNDEIINKINSLNANLPNKRRGITSPFKLCSDIVISYPSRGIKKNTTMKDMPEPLWDLFVEYAEEYYVQIAFGVLIMICSGIRRGECVNLLVKDIKFKKSNQMFYLNIKDRQVELFGSRDINLENSQVKKVRKNQPVLPMHSRIYEIYENHIAYLKTKYNTRNVSDKALFVNAEGNPMSGDSYSKYFIHLKNEFVEYLDYEGLGNLASQLNEYRWGSHIGRHIFTNTIVKNGFANGTNNRPIAKLVAILRGDSCEDSSQVYIDDFTLSEAVAKNINEISKIAMEYTNDDNY
jgi:integrase